MFKSGIIHRSTFVLLLLLFTSVTALGQSSVFSYQGRLTDNGNPADGLFDMQFKLFTTATVGTGTQVGTTISQTLQVTNGAFSVQLDFGACPGCFDGAARFLEISIRPAGSQDPHTVLGLRQPITSAPYAVRSLTAAAADNATQLGGQPATGFIQNTTTQQASTDFNISGSGTAGGTLTGGVVNATTQYNINGLRMLAASGPFDDGATIIAASNTFLGEGAGSNTTPDPTLFSNTGKLNSFLGADAGKANTTGNLNSFFGSGAGQDNMTGCCNAFFGRLAGASNTTANGNSFFGSFAGESNSTGTNNSFFGIFAGNDNSTASRNSFFGDRAGTENRTGNSNTFIGSEADFSSLNTTGHNNSLIGASARVTSGISNATAIGAYASVIQSNTLVLGSISNLNDCTAVNNCASVRVGIGTRLPAQRLHVDGNGAFEGNLGIGTLFPSASLHVSGDTSDVATPLAIIESAGSQAPLAFRSGATEVARVRADSSGNLVLATLSGTSKNIFFRAGDDSSTDMLIQSSTGNVGIGDTTPVDKLDVEGDIRVGTGTTGCVKDANASVIAGTCSSDARLKHSVTAFPESLDKLIKLRPVHFYWRADEYKDRALGAAQSFGLIAQEVERVLPELVTQDEQGLKAVRYNKLPLLMLQAVKELKAGKDEEIAALKVENDKLKQQLKQQEERLRRLEAAMSKVGGKN